MSETRSVDRESRRVIREELQANLLVEAGAGSGKTQMLAERMAAGVATGAYQVDQMAAVTFTRKAASELRGRFHLALEKRLTEIRGLPPADPRMREAERITAALGHLERFFAGTIHSFCARLLRERPVESGVSPGFTELDEVQDLELRKRVWREFIVSARTAGDPDMMALLQTGVRPGDLDSAFATICDNEDVEFPPGDGACPDPRPACKALDKFWAELRKHLPEKIDSATTCAIQKAALQFQGEWRVARNRLDRPAVVASLLDTWDCNSRIIQKWWADSAAEKKRFKDLIEPLHERFCAVVVGPYLTQWRQYVYRLAVTVMTRARDYAASERRRLNSLNYGDLLNLAARVLRGDTLVRRALQQKYRHLFVDEFQDTDPVQAEIVFLLAADEDKIPSGANADVDWRTVPLRPGALFVVGDPKQSIYRFRRADIEIYNIVRDRFSDPSVGRVLPLTMNFRSVPELCQWANGVFETRFPAAPTPQSPQFAALDPKEESGGASKRAPESGVFTVTHSCSEPADVLREDAEKIARYIRTEVDAGRRQYSDFLVLTRKKRDRIAPYADALEALNIPIEVSGAGAFGKSREVEALTVLLRALSDPQDALSLVAVLRGPLFGLSDQELFAFKQAGGWFSVFQRDDVEIEKLPKQAAPVREALGALHQYYRWTRLLPAGAALERILEHTGYLALAATSPGGVEAGDLLHAIDRVRQVVEEGDSLADAADALEADSEASNEVESLPLEPGRTDVVRLMNLHKAKGLEADVVFLADPCGGFKPRVDVHIERKGRKAQGWFKIVRKSEGSFATPLLGEPADWAAHEATELPYLEREHDRLLYVAATRAREMLVVSRWTERKGTPAWGTLNGFLKDAKELPVPKTVAVAQNKPLDCAAKAQAEAHAVRVGAHDGLRQPSWSITSVTAEARHISKMARAAEPAAEDDPTRVVVPDTQSHRADAGMAWGTLIHGLLEHATRHKEATRDDLRRLAIWLTVEQPQLRTVIDEALEVVQRVAAAAFWQEATESDECHVEVPFTRQQEDPSRHLIAGAIDLVYRQPTGWHVVDYKTDRASTDLAEKYGVQLGRYRETWAAMTGERVEASIQKVRAPTDGEESLT